MSAAPDPKGGLGLFGIDDETQAAMAQALAEAAQRQNRSGPSIGAAPKLTEAEERSMRSRIEAARLARQHREAYLKYTDPTTQRLSGGLLSAFMFGPTGSGAARASVPVVKSVIAGGSKVVGSTAKVYGGTMRGIGAAGKAVTTKADDVIEATTKMGRPLARAEAYGRRAIDPKIGGRALSERLPYYELPHESGAALLSQIALGTRRPYLGVLARGLQATGLTVGVDALGNLSIVSDALKNVGGVSSRARGAIRKGAAGAIEYVAEEAAEFIGPKSEDFYNGK